ncbi:MAG: NifU N-terminal domain-containing protein [Caldilineaceae bacterium]|nr:NifU N-terminal domain-containing protein [Caldilineaceae bacterium]
MSIQVQQTPNPNARKFILPGHRFAQSRNFSSAESAAADPVARQLFGLEGVYNVLMAQDFVTVNKRPDVAWEALEAAVIAVLADSLARQSEDSHSSTSARN